MITILTPPGSFSQMLSTFQIQSHFCHRCYNLFVGKGPVDHWHVASEQEVSWLSGVWIDIDSAA